MSDNTHIEFGTILLQSYDAMSPSRNVMNAKLLSVKLYLKNQDCLPLALFHIAEFHKIHTANSPSSFPRDALATTESRKVFTRKKSYKNTKIYHNFVSQMTCETATHAKVKVERPKISYKGQ